MKLTNGHNWEKYYSLKMGDVFVEGGAFLGWHIVEASKKVGNGGRVIAIEPSPPTLELLKGKVCGIPNVTVVEKALWHKKDKADFCIDRSQPSENWSGNRLAGLRWPCEAETIEVETDTLDNILGELKIERVDLLAWDIEGAEMGALEGSHKSLKSGNVLNIALAFYHLEQPRIDYSIHILESYGFEITDCSGILYGGLKK